MVAQRPGSIAELRRGLNLLGGVFLILWMLYGVPLDNLNWDPSFYYAHIRSPVVDGDLDFHNDGQPPFLVGPRTRTGLTPSVWSAGPAVLWAPFFLLAHGVTLGGQRLGLPLTPDGYGPFYIIFSGLGSAFFGWLGVVLCYLIARRVAGVGPALIAALAVWLASPLFYFMYKVPLMSHAPTAAATSAVVYLWLRVADDLDAIGFWFLLGLLIGIAGLMRWQNGLFAAIVPFALRLDRRQPGWLRGAGQRLGLAAAGALLGFLPQMVVWWRIYGAPLAMPQGGGFLCWFRPELVSLLFGSNRGLFVWQPIALLGCAGLVLFARRRHRLGAALILITVLETYLNSVVLDWWGGGGYGSRRFDWFTPILAYGVLPGGVPFPRQQHDQGQPLPGDFFAQIVVGTLREPAFLIATKPSILTTDVPPLQTLLKIARGSPIDLQAVASGAACALAVVLLVATRSIASAMHRRCETGHAYASLALRVSLVALVWVLTASLVFWMTGP